MKLPKLEVRLIEEAKVSFSLKGAIVPEAEPRSSYLDASGHTIWVALKAHESEFPELIGEALQDFFGTPELREFTKDLLSTDGAHHSRMLARWQKRGLSLAKGQEKADGLAAAQEQSPPTAQEQEKNETPKAKPGQGRDSTSTADRSSKKAEPSDETASGDTEQRSQPTHDKTPSSAKSESKQRQDHYRTYVGKDEPQELSDNTGTKREHRDTLNRAGVNRVLGYERGAGRNPTEMPHTHPGYDVESRNKTGEVERFIEVKSCPSDWDRRGVALTKAQFEIAIEKGNGFWLYVVERAASDNFNIIRIQNPGRLVNQFFYDDGWRVAGE